VYVGPYKTSLANTDKPVVFNSYSKLFEKCSLDESIQTFTIAPEGWCVVLKNPSSDDKQPKNGTSNNLMELKVGRKINSPDLITALQAFSDKAVVEKMAESMAPLAILGGKSVAEVLSNLLKGRIVEKVLNNLPEKFSE